jgi:hypothetical protein
VCLFLYRIRSGEGLAVEERWFATTKEAIPPLPA